MCTIRYMLHVKNSIYDIVQCDEDMHTTPCDYAINVNYMYIVIEVQGMSIPWKAI